MTYTKEQIEQAIAVWQDRLRLKHWQITLDWETPPDDENAAASCERIGPRYCAVVKFADTGHNMTPAKVSMIIAHELIHCHLFDMSDVIDNLATQLVPQAQLLTCLTHEKTVECAVDALAMAFSEALPPPDCLLPAKAEQADDEFEDEPFRVTD